MYSFPINKITSNFYLLRIIRTTNTVRKRFFSNFPDESIKKSVLISKSTNIFTNLALEDWYYKNFDFTKHHILLLWKNNPCVVIGRHQNPWLEANISELENISENGAILARRNSGGGTVYHDLGNVNLTFFTSRNLYNRRYNLEIITAAVLKEFGIKLEITKKEDLVLGEYKVSGTASKLGRTTSYHHCTVLFNVNKDNLHRALHKNDSGIKTNATRSIRSKIINLSEKSVTATSERFFNAVAQEYLETTLKENRINPQIIDPVEENYPGITEIEAQFKSWEWCFGRTPEFTIRRSFLVPEHLLENYDNCREFQVVLEIEKGHIKDVTCVPNVIDLKNILVGCKFSESALVNLDKMLDADKHRFVNDCLKQVILI